MDFLITQLLLGKTYEQKSAGWRNIWPFR